MIYIAVKDLKKFLRHRRKSAGRPDLRGTGGERVAILGRNGCGKTTLFKILTGEMDYDGGEVYVIQISAWALSPRFPTSRRATPWRMCFARPFLRP